jgi:hypothetical protein
MNKRSIILRGCPIVNEEGIATETIKPGYLVKGWSYLALQTGTTGSVPRSVALERDELGQGIDNTRQGVGTITAFYASGDTVKVAAFAPGDEALMFVESGSNITQDDLLESNGDGTLTEGSTKPIARALETLGVVAAITALRVQFI